jgi:hypothetical protein
VFIAKFELTFSRAMTTTAKMRLIITADFRLDTKGKWHEGDAASGKLLTLFLGQSEGAWEFYDKGDPFIALLEREIPSGISVLWKSSPDTVAILGKTGRIPIFQGTKGFGSVWAPPKLEFDWKVIEA